MLKLFKGQKIALLIAVIAIFLSSLKEINYIDSAIGSIVFIILLWLVFIFINHMVYPTVIKPDGDKKLDKKDDDT